jgi:hypothetical protein
MANEWTNDTNCKAAWNMDDGALTVDSKGTNTLTNNNVTAETSDYKQGDACGDFDALSDTLSITDGGLDSGFPFKNAESNTTISVCGWFKISALPAAASRYLWGKWSGSPNQSWLQYITATDKHLAMAIGHSGGTELLDTEYEVQTGRWYHVGSTYNASTKAWTCRLWDDTAGSIVYSDGGTSTNTGKVSTGSWAIGSTGSVTVGGFKDEVVVFDDVLTSDEIDQIRQEKYQPTAGDGSGAALLLGMNF